MPTVFDVILPIFAIASLGFISVKFRWVSKTWVEGLASFIFNMGLPVFLFYSIATLDLSTAFPFKFLSLYYASIFILFAIAFVTAKIFFKMHNGEEVIAALGASYANYTLVGLPVLFAVYGDAAKLPAFLIISLHAAIFLTLATVVFERKTVGGMHFLRVVQSTLISTLKNPIVLSLMLGALYNFSNIGFNAIVADTFSRIADTVLPLSLFLIGAQMASFKIKGLLLPAIYLAGLKNLLHPLLVWAIFSLTDDIDPLWISIAVTMAAVPVGVNMLMFANQRQTAINLASTTIFISIGSSILTLSFILWIQNIP